MFYQIYPQQKSVENEFKYLYKYLPVLFNISVLVSIISEEFAVVSENIIIYVSKFYNIAQWFFCLKNGHLIFI